MNRALRAAFLGLIRTQKALCEQMEQMLLVPDTDEGRFDMKVHQTSGHGQDTSEPEYLNNAEESALEKMMQQGYDEQQDMVGNAMTAAAEANREAPYGNQ